MDEHHSLVKFVGKRDDVGDLLGANKVHDFVLSFAWNRAVAQHNAA